jgi:hypothetical protein
MYYTIVYHVLTTTALRICEDEKATFHQRRPRLPTTHLHSSIFQVPTKSQQDQEGKSSSLFSLKKKKKMSKKNQGKRQDRKVHEKQNGRGQERDMGKGGPQRGGRGGTRK